MHHPKRPVSLQSQNKASKATLFSSLVTLSLSLSKLHFIIHKPKFLHALASRPSTKIALITQLWPQLMIPIISFYMFLYAETWESLPRLVHSGVPVKHIPGKNSRIFCFGSFEYCVLPVILFLGFAASSGFCVDDHPMVSVPLGFEISGFDASKNWVSDNGNFAFGFFEEGADFDGFIVGIKYNLGSAKAVNLPVWTVGGGVRVAKNSTFRLAMDGRLILFENPSGLLIWSSNTSSLGVKTASLLDTGNLVLMGSEGNVVWESFSSPTHTLLPGQSLRFPQNLRAPSTKSTSSYYTFVIRWSGELALLWENNVTYWKSHFTSSAVVKEARFDSNGLLGLYDDLDKVLWSVSSKDVGEPSVILRHLRMDQDGNVRIYSWDGVVHRWRVGWQAVEDQCDVFGSCGLYSVCGYNSTGPVCDCLYSDSIDSGSVDSEGSGCKKMVDLGSCKMHTSMLVIKHTVLYGLYPPHDVSIMLSEEGCKEYCSNDTTCIAVTSKNDGSGLCTVKRSNFISGYQSPSTPATSFLKTCLVPQAVAAQGVNPHPSTLLVSKPSGRFGTGGSKKLIGAVAFVVLVTISIVLTLQVLTFWFVLRRRQIKAQTSIPFCKDAKANPHFSAFVRLSFEDIEELTSNFTTQLGASVFKGLLPNKTPVIAKLINETILSEKEFRVAVSTLGGTHHRNLVSLLGFCFEQNHKILIYEYVPNGSLDMWLFSIDPNHREGNWQQKLDIAIGVARGLAYLHSECLQCITHGNLNLDNVLLDEKLVPKLTDFGIQSFLQKETPSSSSESPSEIDIFMLGEMLLQIVVEDRNCAVDGVDQVMDKVIQEHKYLDSDDLRGIERVVRIALWCMQSQPFLRPSIGEVVKILEGSLSVDRPPSSLTFEHKDVEKDTMTEIEVES